MCAAVAATDREVVVRDCPSLVSALDLPVRVRNILHEAGLHRMPDLLELRQRDLLRLSGFGINALVQVQDALSPYGVQLRP